MTLSLPVSHQARKTRSASKEQQKQAAGKGKEKQDRPPEFGSETPRVVSRDLQEIRRAFDPSTDPEIAAKDDVEKGTYGLRIPPIEPRVGSGA